MLFNEVEIDVAKAEKSGTAVETRSSKVIFTPNNLYGLTESSKSSIFAMSLYA
jgi:hypothetical protein